MAYIVLLEKAAEKEVVINGRALVMTGYKRKQRIRVKDGFFHFFDLDFGSTSFAEQSLDPTVSELINWLKWDLRAYGEYANSKFELECIEKAKKDVLPKLRKADKNLIVSFDDERRYKKQTL